MNISNKMKLNLMIIAGEPSGDLLASKLIRELMAQDRLRDATISIFGTGGEHLLAQGQVQLCNIHDMSVIGFGGVIKKIPYMIKLANNLIARAKLTPPDMLILVDYGGFNLRFAKKFKKQFPHIPVVMLVAPQVWVWHYSRVNTLKKYTDLVLCILPFEEELLKSEGINARYIGNPVVENICTKYDVKEEFLKAYDIPPDKKIIGIIPGSRRKEVSALMPVVTDAAKLLNDPDNVFVLSQAASIDDDYMAPYLAAAVSSGVRYIHVKGATPDVMKYSDLLWICSGTATLEAAILRTPMIILYQMKTLDKIMLILLTKLRMAGLPNIIYSVMFSGKSRISAGEGIYIDNTPIIPELLGEFLTPANIIKTNNELMADLDRYKVDLKKISDLFIGVNPSENAAKEIMAILYKN